MFILNSILDAPPSFNHFVAVLKKGSRKEESPNSVGVSQSCPDLSNIEVTHLIPLRDVDILSCLMETPIISKLPMTNKGNRRFIIGPHFLCWISGIFPHQLECKLRKIFFWQKMGDTIFNTDLINSKIPLQTSFCYF